MFSYGILFSPFITILSRFFQGSQERRQNQSNQNNEAFAEEQALNTEELSNDARNMLLQFHLHDAESKRYYLLFNYLQPQPYKLKYYMYFNNNLNSKFDVNYYNRASLNLGYTPAIQHYPRFYDFRYEDEAKHSNSKYYSALMTNTGNIENEKVVRLKEYTGHYSKQMDYINFRNQMRQEPKSDPLQ